MADPPPGSGFALATAAATFAPFGVALFVVADIGRLRILRWSAVAMVVVAVGIVVYLVRRRHGRQR